MTKIAILLAILLIPLSLWTQAPTKENSRLKIGRVKYSGGGDWYNDPSADVNLLQYTARQTNIPIDPVYTYVDLASEQLFAFPVLFLTGHGNMNLSNTEVIHLRTYLQNGGFLIIDDDYGLNEFVRREMNKVFPNQKFTEIPFNHGIFNCHFKFPNGIPKTHQHDEKNPQVFGLFHEKRLCVVYTYEANPSDGWADPDVHKDTEDARNQSLQFGVNVLSWALSN